VSLKTAWLNDGRGWDRTKPEANRPRSTEGDSADDLQGKEGSAKGDDDRPRLTGSHSALGQQADNDGPFIHHGQLSIFDLLGESE
jgi:hypothetical protein